MYVFKGLYQERFITFNIQICYIYKRHIKLLKYTHYFVTIFYKTISISWYGFNIDRFSRFIHVSMLRMAWRRSNSRFFFNIYFLTSRLLFHFVNDQICGVSSILILWKHIINFVLFVSLSSWKTNSASIVLAYGFFNIVSMYIYWAQVVKILSKI